MLNTFFEMFKYEFMIRALIVGILVSLCSALLGVSLVLKRYSMIGDGLSHVGFGSLAIATALGISPLKLTVPVVALFAVALLRLSEKNKLKGDSAIGIISVTAMATGVISVSASKGLNTDLYSYLFGSILAMTREDVFLSVILSAVVLLLYIIFYNKIFAVTFDEDFAKSSGTSANLYNTLIAVLTAITIVLGMRMMGTLIISALIIFPAVTSMRLCKSYKGVTICSAILSILCFCLGLFISSAYNLPTGASIVVVNAVTLVVFMAIEKLKKII